jgi:hypothetical protein
MCLDDVTEALKDRKMAGFFHQLVDGTTTITVSGGERCPPEEVCMLGTNSDPAAIESAAVKSRLVPVHIGLQQPARPGAMWKEHSELGLQTSVFCLPSLLVEVRGGWCMLMLLAQECGWCWFGYSQSALLCTIACLSSLFVPC